MKPLHGVERDIFSIAFQSRHERWNRKRDIRACNFCNGLRGSNSHNEILIGEQFLQLRNRGFGIGPEFTNGIGGSMPQQRQWVR